MSLKKELDNEPIMLIYPENKNTIIIGFEKARLKKIARNLILWLPGTRVKPLKTLRHPKIR